MARTEARDRWYVLEEVECSLDDVKRDHRRLKTLMTMQASVIQALSPATLLGEISRLSRWANPEVMTVMVTLG
jgi:hypothetical protein